MYLCCFKANRFNRHLLNLVKGSVYTAQLPCLKLIGLIKKITWFKKPFSCCIVFFVITVHSLNFEKWFRKCLVLFLLKYMCYIELRTLQTNKRILIDLPFRQLIWSTFSIRLTNNKYVFSLIRNCPRIENRRYREELKEWIFSVPFRLKGSSKLQIM